jgi:2-polyprenyl-3-methyl-5-hydroxy-6-metoxy-1,4-benzoquinol methylase
MNDNTGEKLAKSLTGDTAEIIPFLPYLLQDLWELGSSGQEMLRLLRRHVPITPGFTALDLGCGKGAVSVILSRAIGIRCKGVDLLADFIREANAKAIEYGVDGLCEFAVGDIGESVAAERGYDLVIFGAVGDVLGSHAETLDALQSTVRPGGYILFDDGYRSSDDDSALLFNNEYPTLNQWRAMIEKAGLKLIAYSQAEERPNDARDFECIRRRAQELIKAHPQHQEMFERYVQNQRDEYNDLSERVVGVTFLLQKPVQQA